MVKAPLKPLALVTGASSGIGAATARQLAKAGYDLFLVARREERLKALSEELQSHSVRVQWAALDLRDRMALEQFFSSKAEALSRVEVLVNNAGLARGVEKVQEAEPRDWDEMLETNVRALLAFTRRVLPGMTARGSGHIVNVGSVAGRWVYPGGAVYAATKAAVKSISEGLRMDLIGTGIRVTNVEPGMVETEFSEVRLGSKSASDRVYARMQPLKAEDIADTILWSLQRPAHVNIQEIVIFPTDQAAVGQVHRRSSEGE
ncbi:MAG: SDR family NAD(P)-dependent oxidoreductase [Bdellovibrionaceae bacterium]|nr:SDR family NAD(P)-dependent oxidoreductase [Pseudobdellovibrionaceae bacterium]